MAYRIETTEVKGSPMEVFLFEPKGAGPHPGLVLCQHIPGHMGIEKDPFTLKTAERYAENGYAVSVPFIYHWWPKEADMQVKRDEFRDDWTVPDLLAGYEVLARRKSVDGARIGIAGHCWGGECAGWERARTPATRRARCSTAAGSRRCGAKGTRPPSS